MSVRKHRCNGRVGNSLLVLIENLHPDEGVKNESFELSLFIMRVIKDVSSSKIENKRNNELIYGLADYHLPHYKRNERRGFWFGFTFKNGIRGGIGCCFFC